MPAVIDADALNILAGHPEALAAITQDGRMVVITPHPGEMARLAGMTTAEVQADRLECSAQLRPAARGHGGVEGRAHADRASGRARGREHHRESGHGQGRERRSAHRNGCRSAGAVSKDDPSARSRPRCFCMAWPPTSPYAPETNIPCSRPTAFRHLSQAFRFRSRTANGYVWLQGLPPDSGSRECNEVRGLTGSHRSWAPVRQQQ